MPGHFGRPGCNCLHTGLLPMVGHSEEPEPAGSGWRTSVTGFAEIGKLFPPNVLPADSQFEKHEMAFFNMEFPTQVTQLRRPLLAPRPGTLPKPEIYRRLLVALGELPSGGFPLLRAVACVDRRWKRRRLFPAAAAATLRWRPRLRPYAAFVLYQTLGGTLGSAAAAAPLWGAAYV